MKDNELINFVDWLIKSEEAPKGSSFEETVSWINELSSTDDGKKILNQLINTYKGTSMFKNGGKLDYIFYLKSGGKCKVTKHQETSTLPGSRARGTADAHRGSVTPKYFGNEDQWTTHNGNPAINVFDGDDLHQTVITDGQWGTPRRNRRIITNYATPERSDTLYVDANRDRYPKHPGILGQFGIFSKMFGFDKTHSPEYMQSVDKQLEGFDPKYIHEDEIPKEQFGGSIWPPMERKTDNRRDILREEKQPLRPDMNQYIREKRRQVGQQLIQGPGQVVQVGGRVGGPLQLEPAVITALHPYTQQFMNPRNLEKRSGGHSFDDFDRLNDFMRYQTGGSLKSRPMDRYKEWTHSQTTDDGVTLNFGTVRTAPGIHAYAPIEPWTWWTDKPIYVNPETGESLDPAESERKLGWYKQMNNYLSNKDVNIPRFVPNPQAERNQKTEDFIKSNYDWKGGNF